MSLLLLLVACDGLEKNLIDDVTHESGGDTGRDSGQDSGGPSDPACLPDDQRDTLGAWIHQLWLVAYAAPSASTADAVVSFYQLPGVPQSSWFVLNLATPCSSAHDLDPVCVDGVCFQAECTGVGGGWVNHIENDPDVPDDELTTFDGWIVDRGRLPLTWEDGTTSLALEIDVRALTAPDGTDWTVSGAATFTGDLALEADLPALDADGNVHVSVAAGAGTVSVSDAVIARWDGTNLTSTDCLAL